MGPGVEVSAANARRVRRRHGPAAAASLLAAAALGLACRDAATGPHTPEGPTLTATVTYAAGGTAQVTGSWGTWCNWRTLDTAMHLMSLTAQATPAASPDSAHPALAFVSFAFRGRRFDAVPADFSQALGISGADTVGSRAGTAATSYDADSGTVRLRSLGGGYARVDFDAWYSPAYIPTAPRFRVTGSAEVRPLAECDLP